jgi:hypothetical protein
VRPPDDGELRRTLVLRLALSEFSAKVRTGPPIDDEADLSLPVWAGVVPVRTVRDPAVADDALAAGVELPAYLAP